ncbi:MAG: hypothetical protein GX866_02760 [Firmicutes bacterium]|jgi:hypothetical protein|nr:hypothetical protein [Bacillota bacterium]HPU00482.1 hypothetical protein [Bacillota bacterium]
MKTEINLRTREFVIAREFYWPRLLATLAVIALVVFLVGGTLFLYLYQVQLSIENNNLAQERALLEQQVAPLAELEARLKALEERTAIAEELGKRAWLWSGDFRLILNLAHDRGLKLLHLSFFSDGKVRMRGESGSMRQVALFLQDLAREESYDSAVYRYMAYPRNDRFDFEIEVTITFKGGGEQ